MPPRKAAGRSAPSSPSVDALAAIAVRKAAKLEKSLNKVPAMQRIADEMANEKNASTATESMDVDMADAPAPLADNETVGDQQNADEIAKDEASVNTETDEDDESAESDKDIEMTKGNPIPPPLGLPQQSSPAKAAAKPENKVMKSSQLDEDILADFDVESGSEKEFILEQLRSGVGAEEVQELLTACVSASIEKITELTSAAQSQAPITPVPAPKKAKKAKTPKKESAPADPKSSVLEFVAEFARERAAETLQGELTKEMLYDFREEVYTYGIALELTEPQALLEARKAEIEVTRARKEQEQAALEAEQGDADVMTTEVAEVETSEPAEIVEETAESSEASVPAVEKVVETATLDTAETTVSEPVSSPKKRKAENETISPVKRQKQSEVAVEKNTEKSSGTVDTTVRKLSRKEKQKLYKEEQAKKRPVIAKPKPVAAVTQAPSTATSVAGDSSAKKAKPVVPSKPATKLTKKPAPPQPNMRKRNDTQEPTKSGAPALASKPAPEADNFVDLRAPKKKKRPNKKKPADGNDKKDGENGDKPAAAVATPIQKAPEPAQDKSEKNKAKRRQKEKKKRLAGDKPEATTTEVAADATVPQAAATPKPVTVMAVPPPAPTPIPTPGATPIPPPSKVLPPKVPQGATPAKPATTATTSTPILPPPSVFSKPTPIGLTPAPTPVATEPATEPTTTPSQPAGDKPKRQRGPRSRKCKGGAEPEVKAVDGGKENASEAAKESHI